MTEHLIGEYKVFGETWRLTVPEDEVSRLKINAVFEKLEAAEDGEMSVKLMAILLGILAARTTEEMAHLVPVDTLCAMMTDFKRWTEHLHPVRPC